MSVRFIQFMRTRPLLRRLVYNIQRTRCRSMLEHIGDLLPPTGRILDVGAGTCNAAELLRKAGREVTPLDVADISYVHGITTDLYDGRHMPYQDDAFDVALVLTVLHHAIDPVQVLRECRRVARRIIVMEDVYRNRVHKYATWWWDSLMNLEFAGHPHNNRSDAGWLDAFDDVGLKLLQRRDRFAFLIMWQVTYCLERA